MKLGTITCIYNEADIIESCIKGAYPYVDKMVLLVADNPLYGKKLNLVDSSLKIIKKIPDPKNKLEIIVGSWKEQWRQRKQGLQRLKQLKMTHCIILDADEFYTDKGWKEIREYFANDRIDVVKVKITHFWRSFYYRVVPRKVEYLTVAYKITPELCFVNRLSRGPLYGNRMKTLRKRIKALNIILYHLSYARPIEKLEQKFKTNGVFQRKNRKKFLHKVRRWEENRSMQRLHPLVPIMWRYAKKHSLNDLPRVLKEHEYAGMDIIR